jgi:hypothetical protein
METLSMPETLIHFYEAAWHNIPVNNTLHTHRSENLEIKLHTEIYDYCRSRPTFIAFESSGFRASARRPMSLILNVFSALNEYWTVLASFYMSNQHAQHL